MNVFGHVSLEKDILISIRLLPGDMKVNYDTKAACLQSIHQVIWLNTTFSSVIHKSITCALCKGIKRVIGSK